MVFCMARRMACSTAGNGWPVISFHFQIATTCAWCREVMGNSCFKFSCRSSTTTRQSGVPFFSGDLFAGWAKKHLMKHFWILAMNDLWNRLPQKKNVSSCRGGSQTPAKTHENCDSQAILYKIPFKTYLSRLTVSFIMYCIYRTVYLSTYLSIYLSIIIYLSIYLAS